MIEVVMSGGGDDCSGVWWYSERDSVGNQGESDGEKGKMT